MEVKICSNILKLRKENKMTQAHVAEYLGVSPQAVSKWEQEMAMPDIYLIPKIAFLFNVSIDVLFGTTDLDTTDLLVSKYATLRTERHYKDAKEAVDALLDMDPQNLKGHGLLAHLEYQRALEYIGRSRQACENLVDLAGESHADWWRRGKMQVMRLDAMVGNYDFLECYVQAFDRDRTVDNLNFLLVAMGEKHEYKEIRDLGQGVIEDFDDKEQGLIYPNLMEAAFVLGDLSYGQKCFEKILAHNDDKAQIFNAWWLMWKLYVKAGLESQAETCKTELLRQLPDQNINEYFEAIYRKHLEGEGDQLNNFL